jgi:hypothetical protein
VEQAGVLTLIGASTWIIVASLLPSGLSLPERGAGIAFGVLVGYVFLFRTAERPGFRAGSTTAPRRSRSSRCSWPRLANCPDPPGNDYYSSIGIEPPGEPWMVVTGGRPPAGPAGHHHPGPSGCSSDRDKASGIPGGLDDEGRIAADVGNDPFGSLVVPLLAGHSRCACARSAVGLFGGRCDDRFALIHRRV